MKIPRREVLLPGGLRCAVSDVEAKVASDHVVRHVLGVDAVNRYGEAAWDREGWSALAPSVVSPRVRDERLRTIAELVVGAARCGVPAIVGTRSSANDGPPCDACLPGLAWRCERELDDVVAAYVQTTSELLERFGLPDAVWVPRAAVTRAVARQLRTPENLSGLATLSLGFDSRSRGQRIARLLRADGLRAEFYLQGTNLKWRTTFREVPAHAVAALNWVLLFPMPLPSSEPLSDRCLVARLWWERHGN